MNRCDNLPRGIRRLVLIALLALAATTGWAENSKTNRVIGFELTDQFNEPMTLKPPFEKPVIVTVADKQGSAELEGWIAPIQKEFGGEIEFFAVADLRGVPGLLRGMVRRGFKKEFTHPIALDWKGAAADQLDLVEDRANLFLLDRSGFVMIALHGKASKESLETMTTAVILQRSGKRQSSEFSAPTKQTK